jgi:hypothetical protein
MAPVDAREKRERDLRKDRQTDDRPRAALCGERWVMSFNGRILINARKVLDVVQSYLPERVQGYLAHEKQPPPPCGRHRALGIFLP